MLQREQVEVWGCIPGYQPDERELEAVCPPLLTRQNVTSLSCLFFPLSVPLSRIVLVTLCVW